jgi:hypothetical protein
MFSSIQLSTINYVGQTGHLEGHLKLCRIGRRLQNDWLIDRGTLKRDSMLSTAAMENILIVWKPRALEADRMQY